MMTEEALWAVSGFLDGEPTFERYPSEDEARAAAADLSDGRWRDVVVWKAHLLVKRITSFEEFPHD